MTGKEYVSDELLNAFIDNELDKPERERVLERVEHDQVLAQRLCELTRLKELVRMARPELETSPRHVNLASRLPKVQSYAALLILTFAISLLMFMFLPENRETSVSGQALVSIVEQQADSAEIKLVMLVTRADPSLLYSMLNEVEALLKRGPQLHKPLRIEIVAAGKGLDLLRSDKSPYAYRINRLRQQYDNLLFVACQETLQKVQENMAQQVSIINGIAMVHSGPGEVQLRRSQGWAVVKI